jgi:hypothetical protein
MLLQQNIYFYDLPKMRRLTSYLVLVLLLLNQWGCTTTGGRGPEENTPRAHLPKYSILIQDTVRHAPGFSGLPRRIYVFPPLLTDSSLQPLGGLRPVTLSEGELFWSSDAPRAGEIRENLHHAMEAQGHRAISFEQLNALQSDHAATVLNLYFSKPRAEIKAGERTGRWLASLRITASTYPASLDPSGKRDLLQAEALIVFGDEEQYLDAIMRGFRSLAGRLQSRGVDTRRLSLLG